MWGHCRGCHQSSRKKRIDWIPCYKSVLPKNPEPFHHPPSQMPLETRNKKHGKHLVNPKKGGQDTIFTALHVPKPCAGHRRHSRRNVLKTHVVNSTFKCPLWPVFKRKLKLMYEFFSASLCFPAHMNFRARQIQP